VKNHVISTSIRELQKSLASSTHKELGLLIEIIRPPNPKIVSKDKLEPSSHEAIEIGAQDLSDHGAISKGKREVQILHQISQNLTPAYLEEGDIVMIIKGSVGKVGIVTKQTLNKNHGPLILGQSAIGLRIKTNTKIDAKTLFLWFRSVQGQLQLSNLVAGTATPLIQTRNLLAVRVPEFSKQEEQTTRDIFDEECELQEKIEVLSQRQIEIADKLWTTSNNGGNNVQAQ
jgi:type I restriction enzyme M protein